jgi:Fe-S cluster assembly ATP-binding protein
VHVLYNGQIIESGGPELAHRLEAEGYDNLIKEKETEAA